MRVRFVVLILSPFPVLYSSPYLLVRTLPSEITRCQDEKHERQTPGKTFPALSTLIYSGCGGSYPHHSPAREPAMSFVLCRSDED